jgi:hypothetical protein
MLTEYEIIGPEYFTGIDRIELERIVANGSYSKELVFSSKIWSIALQNYLILTHRPDLISNIQRGELHLLFNRYYWFKMFYYLYSRDNGKDAGIEQQISMLVETIGNKVKDFNWSELQRIDKNIESLT